MISVAAYLRSLGIDNPLHLAPEGLPPTGSLPRASWQERGLVAMARDGDARFRPWDALPADVAPIKLWFSADPPSGDSPAYRFR